MKQNIKLRIKFRKYGPIRFIGHLDVMRFFQKAIRRAGIDVAYTGGFSPHQIMTFAAPLGVGLESNGEYMDIEVCSFTSCHDVLERLNGACVPGIDIVSVRVLPDTAGNAMASVAAAAYTVAFRDGREPQTDIAKALPGFLAKDEILYTKETKKGRRELDLKPGIYKLTYLKTGNGKEGNDDGSFFMLLDASSAGNIKPVQVVEAFLAENGETLQENALLITREDVYANIGTKDAPRLVTLEDMTDNIPEWADSGRCKVHECTRKHNVQFCGICQEFPCKELTSLIHWNPGIIEQMTAIAKKYREGEHGQ